MSARMTYCPQLDSDNESDEDTSHSLHQNISKRLRHLSDTESSDERHPIPQSSIVNTKYTKEFRYTFMLSHLNHYLYCYILIVIYFYIYFYLITSFSLRRAKLDSQRIKPMSSNVNKVKNLSHDIHKPESVSNRPDSGRSGVRVNRTSSMVIQIFFIIN
jgi:hypothetical protein